VQRKWGKSASPGSEPQKDKGTDGWKRPLQIFWSRPRLVCRHCSSRLIYSRMQDFKVDKPIKSVPKHFRWDVGFRSRRRCRYDVGTAESELWLALLLLHLTRNQTHVMLLIPFSRNWSGVPHTRTWGRHAGPGECTLTGRIVTARCDFQCCCNDEWHATIFDCAASSTPWSAHGAYSRVVWAGATRVITILRSLWQVVQAFVFSMFRSCRSV